MPSLHHCLIIRCVCVERQLCELQEQDQDCLLQEDKDRQELGSQTSQHQSEMSDMESALSLQRLDLPQTQKLESYTAKEQSNEEEVTRPQSMLDQLESELPLKQQERAQLKKANTQVQALQNKVKLLRLRLEDGKKSGEVLIRQERKSLTLQLEQLRLDNQQLRAALLEAKLRLNAVEQGKSQQHIALSEKTSSVHLLTLETQQMNSELESQHKTPDQLQEQKALREEDSKRIKELQRQNSKLKAERNNIRNALEQARSTLKALECADEHGLKVALGIQEEMTAKREQVDLLQSRVQMLTESTEKLTKEKNYQVMKSKRHAQLLLFERKNRKRLECELEASYTKENVLKSEIKRLDAALQKMSDSFAECQEFIQEQQQEIIRLKLQHTLELKEGQKSQSTCAKHCEGGQDLQTKNIYRCPISSPTIPAQVPVQADPASQLNRSSQRCSPVRELQVLVKELRSVIDMDESAETSSTSSISPRDEDTKSGCRKTAPSSSYNKQNPVRVPNLNGEDKNADFLAKEDAGLREDRNRYTSFDIAALGRRSPVHSLLTSDLPCNIHNIPRTQISTYTLPTSFIKQAEITKQRCQKQQMQIENLQNKAEDHQKMSTEMNLMGKSQEKIRKRIKEKKKDKITVQTAEMIYEAKD